MGMRCEWVENVTETTYTDTYVCMLYAIHKRYEKLAIYYTYTWINSPLNANCRCMLEISYLIWLKIQRIANGRIEVSSKNSNNNNYSGGIGIISKPPSKKNIGKSKEKNIHNLRYLIYCMCEKSKDRIAEKGILWWRREKQKQDRKMNTHTTN